MARLTRCDYSCRAMTTPIEPHPAPRDLWAWQLLAILLLVGVSSVYARVDHSAEILPPSDTFTATLLAWIVRGLTLPLPALQAADVRVLLLPLAAGIALLLLAARSPRPASASATGSAPLPTGMSAAAWFDLLVGGVLLLGWTSALANGTGYSHGWLITFAAGALWAHALGAAIPAQKVPSMLATALAVAVGLFALALWHRQVTGLRYFSWPIGPITPTANLAALIAASGVGGLFAGLLAAGIGRADRKVEVSQPPAHSAGRAEGFLKALVVASLIIALAALWIAQRRAALAGAAGGVGATLLLMLSVRRMPRWCWSIVVVLTAVSVGLVCAWLRTQLTSVQREISGPVALRLVYWQAAARGIASDPFLGHGPDSFAEVVTPALARQRAEQPQVFHGNIDPEAHQEWLQAALELGLPGGLCYALIPLAVIGLAWRAAGRCRPSRSQIVALGALTSGVAAVLIGECASTSLRGPILPAWLWTWLGLILASAKLPPDPERAAVATTAAEPPAPAGSPAGVGSFGLLRRLLIAAIGLAFLGAAISEQTRITDQVAARRAIEAGSYADALRHLAAAGDRWGFGAWLAVRTEAAQLESDLAAGRMKPGDEPATQFCDPACDHWRMLATRFAGMLDHEVRYADALIVCGRKAEAREVLERRLRSFDPYDVFANLTMARLFDTLPAVQLDRIIHALRSSQRLPEMEQIAIGALKNDFARQEMVSKIGDATAAISHVPPTVDWGASLLPEWLRLAAWYQQTGGDRQGLLLQALACEAYDRLDRSNSMLRRTHEAEWGAWFGAVRMMYEMDPTTADDPEMSEFIERAEAAALLGNPHERLRGGAGTSTPERNLLGSELIPTQIPPSHRPFWAFSAMIHLAANRTDYLNTRAMLALPPEQRTPDAIRRLIESAARRIVEDFATLPADKRPAAYDRLVLIAAGEPEKPT